MLIDGVIHCLRHPEDDPARPPTQIIVMRTSAGVPTIHMRHDRNGTIVAIMNRDLLVELQEEIAAMLKAMDG